MIVVHTSYDYIIVGGRSAGSVLAHRLSARSRNAVLLVEAGRDYSPGREPAGIRDTFYTAAYQCAHLWPDTRVHWTALPGNEPEPAPVFFQQARVMGGGSSVNSMIALRGMPGDFEEWVALGTAGWSWKEVLPFYRRLERDLDFTGDVHGDDGRIPVRPACARRVAAVRGRGGEGARGARRALRGRHERVLRRRLLRGADEQSTVPAGVGRDGLPRPGDEKPVEPADSE